MSFLRFLREKLSYLDPFFYAEIFVLFVYKKLNIKHEQRRKLVVFEFVFYMVYAFFLAFLLYFLLTLILATKTPVVVVLSNSMQPTFSRGDLLIVKGADIKNIKAEHLLYEGDKNLENMFLWEYAEPIYKEKSYQTLGILFPVKDFRGPYSEFLPGKILIRLDQNTIGDNDIVVYRSEHPNSEKDNLPIIHRAIVNIETKDGFLLLTKGDNKEHNFLLDQDCGEDNKLLKYCITTYPVSKIKGKTIGRIPYLGYVKIFFSEIFFGRRGGV